MDILKRTLSVMAIGIFLAVAFAPIVSSASDADDEKIYTQKDLDDAVWLALTSYREVFKYTQEDYDRALDTVPPGYFPMSEAQDFIDREIAEYKANAHLVEEWYFYATIILAIALVGAIVLYVCKK